MHSSLNYSEGSLANLKLNFELLYIDWFAFQSLSFKVLCETITISSTPDTHLKAVVGAQTTSRRRYLHGDVRTAGHKTHPLYIVRQNGLPRTKIGRHLLSTRRRVIGAGKGGKIT